MSSVNLPVVRKKRRTRTKTSLQGSRPIDRDVLQPARLISGRLTPSRSSLPNHHTARSLRQNQILQMQQLYGNVFVQRMLASDDPQSTLQLLDTKTGKSRLPQGRPASDLQRDQAETSSGNELVIEQPMVITGDPNFHKRAERLNKRYAKRPPQPGWPYTDELRSLWSSQAYDDFADTVREFQWQNIGEDSADGILGPNTAKALQGSSRTETETETDEPEVSSETPISAAAPASGASQEQARNELASTEVADLRARYRQIQDLLAQGTLSPEEQAAFEAEAELVREALIDAITSESIKLDLEAFNNIKVDVPTGDKSVSITVRAAYFIHTDAGEENVRQARKKSKFSSIKKTLQENSNISLMKTGKGKEMHSGFAVEYGKATPDDLRLFIQEAINSGAIERYAKSKKKLSSGKTLGDLDANTLQEVTQQWIYDNGVGVDCSGFVVQTQVNAREKVRAEMASLGVSESDMPGEITSNVRNAKSFKKEASVSKPSELRPGDAWVTTSGGHIRILTDVKQVRRGDKDIIEFKTAESSFKTAESSGGAESREKGQIAKTRRTAGLDDWGRIKGSFHRL